MKKIWKKLKKIIKKINKEDIIIFMIPLIMFGVYLIILYPGVLSYDSYFQLNQIEANSFNTAHPFFHTFIEMVLMKIWNSPAVIGLFQILVFSFLWTKICSYNRKKGSKLLFIFQVLLTFLIALNPLSKVISITLWKDVLYSYTILWFCFELEKLIDKKFKIDLKNIIKLSFLLLLIPNLRHNGYIITIFLGIILTIILIIYDRKSWNYLKLIAFSVMFFLSFQLLGKLYNVDEGMDVGETGSIIDYKFLSLSGEIAREGNLSSEDVMKLKEYANYDNLFVYSHYHQLDYIWLACNPNLKNLNNTKEFYTLMGKIISKNKVVSLKYFMKETSFIWRIVRYNDSYGIINYLGIKAENTENPYERKFEDTGVYELIFKYIGLTRTNKIFQTIYYSGSLCLYLIAAILIYLKKKHKINMILIVLPIVFNLLGLVLTMPVNDVRYYYSNFLLLYLMAVIFLKYWVKDEK